MDITNVTETGFRVSVSRDECHSAILRVSAVCESHGVSLFPAMGEEGDTGTFLDIQFQEAQTFNKVGDIIKELQTGVKPPWYMVTTTGHGRMHLNPMRVFAGDRAEFEARAYVASIPREDGLAVMYEVRPNSPPKKVQGIYQGRATRGT